MHIFYCTLMTVLRSLTYSQVNSFLFIFLAVIFTFAQLKGEYRLIKAYFSQISTEITPCYCITAFTVRQGGRGLVNAC